jgi:hypothetical protein
VSNISGESFGKSSECKRVIDAKKDSRRDQAQDFFSNFCNCDNISLEKCTHLILADTINTDKGVGSIMRRDVAFSCDGSHSALDVLQIIGKDRKLVQLVADLCRQDICNSGWRESVYLVDMYLSLGMHLSRGYFLFVYLTEVHLDVHLEAAVPKPAALELRDDSR